MKILSLSSLLNTTPPVGYGGTERFIHILCNSLVERGHEVTVVAKEDSQGGLYDTVTTDESNITETLRTVYKTFKPDLVHINTKDAGVMEFMQTEKIPTVITFYNNFRKTSSWVEIIQNSPKHFHFTTISNNLKLRVLEALAAKMDTSDINMQVTGYGMDVSLYQKAFEEMERDKYIYLGVMARYKGVLDVAKTFSVLDEELLIVGPCNNPFEKDYFEDVLALTNKGNIEYYGETKTEEEKINLLQSSKALIIATGYDPLESDCHEAFGLVMLEANSVGTPVLGYDQGNISDYVVDGLNGYKFSSLDELPNLMKKIDNSTLSSKCMEYAKNFDIQTVSKNYEHYFRTLI